MVKKLTKYAIIILVILLAELISAYLLMVLQKYKSESAPYFSTAISMVTSVLVFYPLLTYMAKHLKTGSQKFVKETQNVTKHPFMGLFLGFSLAVFLMFIAFARIWYNRNFVDDVKSWIETSL